MRWKSEVGFTGARVCSESEKVSVQSAQAKCFFRANFMFVDLILLIVHVKFTLSVIKAPPTLMLMKF